jgi:DNA repair exonuclease SbcCD ATPase subunit
VVDFVKPVPDANCPHCNGELTIRGKSVAPSDDGQALRHQHEEHMDSIKQQMADINNKMSILDETIAKEAELNQLLQKVKQKRSDEYASYKAAISRISELKSSLKINRSSVDSINARLQASKDLEDKINLLQQDILELKTKNIKLQQDASLLKAAVDIFGPSGAPAYTMDSIIESFNIAIAKMLDTVWPLASYKINSYRENSDGQITTKFSESFSVAGRESSIGALSGGEQRILSLIIDFAVIDILSSQFGMRLNPIIMDEPFEGLDATSREQVIDVLDTLSADRQIIVVDHATEAKSMFTKIIKVEKRSGVTSIAP